jgi:hypothetical protein
MPAPDEPIRVTIVSAKKDTLDDLAAYLEGVGVDAQRSRSLDVVRTLAPHTAAVIVFPDDFAWQEVVMAVTDIAAPRTRILPVLVTRQRERYERRFADTDYVLVVPKPVWAWSLFDAVRDHLGRSSQDAR